MINGLPYLGEDNEEDYTIPPADLLQQGLPKLLSAIQRLPKKTQAVAGLAAQNVVAKGREETPSGNFFESERWKKLSPVLLSVGARLLDNSNRYSRVPSGPFSGVGQAAVQGVRAGQAQELRKKRLSLLEKKLTLTGETKPTVRAFTVGDKTVYKQWNSKSGSWETMPGVGGPRKQGTQVSVTVPINNIPLPKRATSKVATGILNSDNSVERLNRVSQLYRPEFSTYRGQGTAFVAKQLDKIGMTGPDQRRHLEGYATWKAEQAQFFNEYRKYITGVAAGEKEIRLLEGSIPSVNDSPAEYQAKMAGLVAITTKLRDRHFTALKKGLKPRTPEYRGFLRANPIDGSGGKTILRFDAQGNPIQ